MPTDTHLTPEQVDAYVTAGLPPADRAAAAAHAAACPACAAAVAAVERADADLRRALPATSLASLEDRVVARLRTARRPLSPPARRAALAAAAAVAVVATGWAGSSALSPTDPTRAKDSSNLHQIGLAVLMHGADASQLYPSSKADWQSNPFVGTQHDNIYTGKTAAAPAVVVPPPDAVDGAAAAAGTSDLGVPRRAGASHQWALKSAAGADRTPYDSSDSILLPADDDGRKNPTTPPPPPPGAAAAFDPTGVPYRIGVDGLAKAVATGNVTGLNYFYGATSEAQAGPKPAGIPDTSRRFGTDSPRAVLNDPDVVVTAPFHPVGHQNDVAAAPAGAYAAPGSAATRPAVDGRKVIRTGTMSFDVDRFDTAVDTLAKVVAEAGGYVATTDSQKGANGKTVGTVTVRCPPERLDLLVLGLRALGDLTAQQITAQDVTKEYTDDESELTADRAMQDRLLDLIRTGKGSIKDLLAAENELGTWRVKIEKLQGQLRFMDAQIGLSTLAVTLSERDLRQAATAIETETADVGLETDDVEHARDAALKAVDDAHGRVIAAELKRLDAGQLAARIVADVPPEMAGATLDRLRQLGRVARFEVERQQTTPDDARGAAVRTERRPTRVTVSIYNLANVAPRRTTAVTLAAGDPEAAYAAVLAIASPGGRVVTSNLDRAPGEATGTVVLEIPPARLEAAVAALASQGVILKRTAAEVADTQATTDAKVGLTVTLQSLAAVPPRETAQQTVAAADVPVAYRSVLSAAAAAKAHVRSANLNEQDHQNVTADVTLDVPRAALPDFDRALSMAGDTVARTSARSTDEGPDVSVRLQLSIMPADRLPPRETTTLTVETADVDKAAADAQAAAVAAGGRVVSAAVSRSPAGPSTAKVVLDVPLSQSADVVRDLRQLGTVRGVDADRDAAAPAGPLAHAHVELDLATADALVADSAGPWASVRHGLSVGLAGLLWSLQLIVVGLCLLVPWAVVGYVARRVWRRVRSPRPA